MSIESVYYVFDNESNYNVIKPGTYFCYECNKKQVVSNNERLNPCPKCGSTSFYQQ